MGAVGASELSNISLGENVLNSLEAIIGLPEFQITAIAQAGQTVTVSVEYTGKVSCPKCGGSRLRKKDTYRRQVRQGEPRSALVRARHKSSQMAQPGVRRLLPPAVSRSPETPASGRAGP